MKAVKHAVKAVKAGNQAVNEGRDAVVASMAASMPVIKFQAEAKRPRWELTQEDGVGVMISRTTMTIWDNIGGLVMFGVMAVIIGAFLVAVAYLAWGIYRRWKVQYEQVAQADSVFASDTSASASAATTLMNSDDLPVPKPVGPDGMDADLPSAPSGALLRSRMAKIKAKYGAYNKALSKYLQVSHRGTGPNQDENDDLIDARILSRSDDDFTYEKDRVPRGDDGLPADPRV
jgi:hypothetical protein